MNEITTFEDLQINIVWFNEKKLKIANENNLIIDYSDLLLNAIFNFFFNSSTVFSSFILIAS